MNIKLFTLLAFFSLLMSCGGDEGSPDTQALLTSGSWKVQSIMVDNVSRTSLYPNLTIAFTATGFTASNGDPVWPATGTWQFVGSGTEKFTRGDGVEVTIQSISESELRLALTWSKSTLAAGRGLSVKGNHVFLFVKL